MNTALCSFRSNGLSQQLQGGLLIGAAPESATWTLSELPGERLQDGQGKHIYPRPHTTHDPSTESFV